MTTLKPDSQNFSTPVIIYQSSSPETIISISNCQNSPGGILGYVCFIHGQSTPQSLTPGTNFWKMISFLSTGRIINSIDLSSNFVIGNDVITYNMTYALHNGGILMLGPNQNGTLRGSIFNDNGVYAQDWGLPTSNGMITSYSENTSTIWAVAPASNSSSWSVYSTDLPSLLPNVGTTSITITYRQEVAPSIANISIYQYTNSSDNLRQTLSSNSSQVRFITGQAIEINLLSSTFNQEGANYFVTIDPSFVILRGLGEPIPGVNNGTWSFFTGTSNNTFTDNIDVAVRLTIDGSTYFDGLNENGRINFYNDLTSSIAAAISVDPSRVSMQRRYQHDGSVEPFQILLRLTLVAANQTNQINTQVMFESLRVLVGNKTITPLMFYNSSASLDSSFE
ncbi:10140_t:CDS:2, partial [Scutellospora calospora]